MEFPWLNFVAVIACLWVLLSDIFGDDFVRPTITYLLFCANLGYVIAWVIQS